MTGTSPHGCTAASTDPRWAQGGRLVIEEREWNSDGRGSSPNSYGWMLVYRKLRRRVK